MEDLKSIMFEQNCDKLLQCLYENPKYNEIVATFEKIETPERIRSSVSGYLQRRKHIEVIQKSPDSPILLKITEEGSLFALTTSYIEEREKADLTRLLNRTSVVKMQQDIKINQWLLKTKWIPHILGVAAIGISLASYFRPSEQVKILPIQVPAKGGQSSTGNKLDTGNTMKNNNLINNNK